MIGPVLVTSLFVGGCGGASSAQADERKALATLGGDDRQTAADNPQCKLFSRAEVAKYIGTPVSAGRDASGGCQWLSTTGNGDVIVAVVPAAYHEPPSRAAGFRLVPDVGTKAFVAPLLGGFVAGAIVGAHAVRVSVAGPAATETSAIALLKETIKRRSS